MPLFCEQPILPELQRLNVNEIPVLKPYALKFLMIFRSLLRPVITIVTLFLMIKHLQAESVMVHSYAACAVDKVLIIRGQDNKSPLVAGAQLASFSNELFIGLLGAL